MFLLKIQKTSEARLWMLCFHWWAVTPWSNPLISAGPQRFAAPGSVRHPNSGVMAHSLLTVDAFVGTSTSVVHWICLPLQSKQYTLVTCSNVSLQILFWGSHKVTGLQEKEFGQKYPQWKLNNVQHWNFCGRFCIPMKRGPELDPWYFKFLLL